eukprot:1009484-Alexandrium_andersonii.AAC.1
MGLLVVRVRGLLREAAHRCEVRLRRRGRAQEEHREEVGGEDEEPAARRQRPRRPRRPAVE